MKKFLLQNQSLLRKSILLGLFLWMTIFHVGIHKVYCDSDWLTPSFPCRWLGAQQELALWSVIFLLFLVELIWDHGFKDFFTASKSVWPVFLFVFLAVFSLTWSIAYPVTLYKIVILIISTLLAIYTGKILGSQKLLDMLVWFFAVLCILNLGSVLLFPKISITSTNNVWNGIFIHRNYLGCFMALGLSIFLIKLLDWKNLNLPYKIVCPSMSALAILFLVKAESANGILTAIILASLCLVIAAWLRFEKVLKPVHYYIFLAVFITFAALIFTNLEWIFGLLGRDTSLTRRVPMWRILFESVIPNRPLLGYGYGVVWSLAGFCIGLRNLLGVGGPRVIADNGFIDILLHLGILGLTVLIGLIVIGFIRAVKYFLKMRTLVSALPLVLLVFAIVPNIALSLILETESFVWAMVIASQVVIGAYSVREPAKPT